MKNVISISQLVFLNANLQKKKDNESRNIFE